MNNYMDEMGDKSYLSSEIMWINKKTLIGSKPYFYELSEIEGFDINTPFEFKFAEYLFENENN